MVAGAIAGAHAVWAWAAVLLTVLAAGAAAVEVLASRRDRTAVRQGAAAGRGVGRVRLRRVRLAREWARGVAVACALACVVAWSGAFHAATALPGSVRDAMGRGGDVTVWGTVVQEPREAGRDAWTGRPRWAVRIAVSEACVEPCPASAGARAVVDAVLDGAEGAVLPRLGDRGASTGSASPSHDSRVDATLWRADFATSGAKDPVAAVVASARGATREAAAGLPDTVRGLVLGMVMGDTSDMPASLDEQMKVTGLTHLTAVSGSHFAIVTLVLGALLRRSVRRRWVRAAVLAAAMSALAAFVGAEPSVQRALTMALALAAAIAWGRPARALPALGAGLLVLLVGEPGLAGALGLQLSAVAVVAIVVWAPPLASHLAGWLWRPLAHATAVPLSAWLACWPLLLAIRPGVGTYTVPANLVASLAAFPVTIVGLAGAVLAVPVPGVATVLMHGASWPAWAVVWSAQFFARAPGAWLPWPAGWRGEAAAVAVVALLAAGTMSARLRGAARLALVLAAAASAVAVPVLTAASAGGVRDAAIVVCDVGQGDMMIVPTESGGAVVIDTGPPGGEGVACLRRYAVTSIDLLILTHPHADHDGAVGELEAIAPVREAWVSPVAHEAGLADAVVALEGDGVPASAPASGETWERGDVRLAVLYPTRGALSAETSAQINDTSVTVWIDAGGVTALALGDLETDGQDAVRAALGGPVAVDMVKVAHHGSATQSDGLAALLGARVAAISVGEGNTYGHPDPGTVALYGQVAGVVLTTMDCGDIALTRQAQIASSCPLDVAG